MIERPILFGAPMVLALLAGTKTQTRRILKQRPRKDGAKLLPELLANIGVGAASPYGVPGDRLWVKETWRPVLKTRAVERIRYEADGALQIKMRAPGWKRPEAAKTGNVTPLFMPRWASRITLEIASVCVERLHAITEGDAIAEGIERSKGGPWLNYGPEGGCVYTARHSYESLWESINGAGSWALNPWVWVVKFTRSTP